MKYLSIILILLFSSCEDALSGLEEQTAPLSGLFYILEGWDEFMNQNYDSAKDLFSAALLADEGSETNYYDYAYTGLGWTAIYKANINPGIDNKILRGNLRNEAIENFEFALQLIGEIEISAEADASQEDDDEENVIDELLYANILAGVVFNNSYLALDKAMEFYSDGSNQLAWEEALNYSQIVIEHSDSLLVRFPQYDFQYDDDIDFNDIRFLRAQSFVRLGDLENAVIEIELLDPPLPTSVCDLEEDSVIECLHSVDLNP